MDEEFGTSNESGRTHNVIIYYDIEVIAEVTLTASPIYKICDILAPDKKVFIYWDDSADEETKLAIISDFNE